MGKYRAAVLVQYIVDADSVDDAWEKIESGAEFPVLPYDEGTYCDSTQIVGIFDMEEEQSEQA